MRRSIAVLLVVVAALAAATTFAGCVETSSGTANAGSLAHCMKRAERVNVADGGAPVADPSADAAYISITDVSKSTEDTRASYLPDMVTFARRAAHAHALYYADAFGGAPHKHARYPVQANFSGEPIGFAGNETLADASRDCDAVSLTVPLRTLTKARPGAPGSPLLEMLEMAGALSAQQPELVPYVAVFTDAELVESDFDVRHDELTDARLTALARTWRPRLRALRGAHVYVVGVGRGSDLSQRQIDDVQQLLETVLDANDARLEVFDARFAQGR